MGTHIIAVTRRIPKNGIDMLSARKDIELRLHDSDAAISRPALKKLVRGASGILALLTERIDDDLLDAAGPQLKVVANLAVGFDNIDLAACAKRGIVVANTPGVLTTAVAEHTFALMMAICRRVVEADSFLRKGKYKAWGPLMFLGLELEGKTFGVIGLGRIGIGVAQRASKGMGMKVVYNDVKRNEQFEKDFGATYMSVEDVLKTADVVSLHVPLLPTTRHLINADRLRLMKPTAYLINTSRGPIIDERALTQTLKRKEIAGAALDVFETEPKLAPGLAKLDNVVVTPHIASATIEARGAMARLAAQAIIDVMDGKTPQFAVKSS